MSHATWGPWHGEPDAARALRDAIDAELGGKALVADDAAQFRL